MKGKASILVSDCVGAQISSVQQVRFLFLGVYVIDHCYIVISIFKVLKVLRVNKNKHLCKKQ